MQLIAASYYNRPGISVQLKLVGEGLHLDFSVAGNWFVQHKELSPDVYAMPDQMQRSRFIIDKRCFVEELTKCQVVQTERNCFT